MSHSALAADGFTRVFGDELRPLLFQAIGETFRLVGFTLLIGGALGLLIGVVLYATSPGNLCRTYGSSTDST